MSCGAPRAPTTAWGRRARKRAWSCRRRPFMDGEGESATARLERPPALLARVVMRAVRAPGSDHPPGGIQPPAGRAGIVNAPVVADQRHLARPGRRPGAARGSAAKLPLTASAGLLVPPSRLTRRRPSRPPPVWSWGHDPRRLPRPTEEHQRQQVDVGLVHGHQHRAPRGCRCSYRPAGQAAAPGVAWATRRVAARPDLADASAQRALLLAAVAEAPPAARHRPGPPLAGSRRIRWRSRGRQPAPAAREQLCRCGAAGVVAMPPAAHRPGRSPAARRWWPPAAAIRGRTMASRQPTGSLPCTIAAPRQERQRSRRGWRAAGGTQTATCSPPWGLPCRGWAPTPQCPGNPGSVTRSGGPAPSSHSKRRGEAGRPEDGPDHTGRLFRSTDLPPRGIQAAGSRRTPKTASPPNPQRLPCLSRPPLNARGPWGRSTEFALQTDQRRIRQATLADSSCALQQPAPSAEATGRQRRDLLRRVYCIPSEASCWPP